MPAYLMARNALARYVKFRCFGREPESAGHFLDDLMELFSYKNGASIYLPYLEEEFDFLGKILKAAHKLGIK